MTLFEISFQLWATMLTHLHGAGFETGLKSMKVGGRRRLLVPPDLGPPVGPSTFFSAKQCEVFDVELLSVKSCRRQQFGFTSKMVCDVDPAAEKRV